MKKLSLFIVLICTVLIWTPGWAQNSETSQDGVLVYYFHGTTRCVTCLNMEKYTKEVLETDYAKEMKNGKVKYEVIDFNEDANKEIVQKYNVESSTLLIVKIKAGKEKVTDLTELGFSYAKYDPEKFKNGVTEKLNKNLR